MSTSELLHAVRLTPPGRGAIATILLEGPNAFDFARRLIVTRSGRPFGDLPENRPTVGRLDGEVGEEIVVCRRGSDSVELHCHGGHAASAWIEETLRQKGCRVLTWQQWTAETESDPTAAAALVALAEASTERTAGILLDQYHGALRRAFEEIEQALKQEDVLSARRKVESLAKNIPLGKHLIEPWRVVMAGPPNVGKSSLINALVGYRRSIVHDAPGTTRDAVTARTAVDGWPIELCDTAGLHARAEGIEKAGVALAQQRADEADLVVLVFDRSAAWSPADQILTEDRPQALIVHNKVDLPPSCEETARPAGVFTSATAGRGIEDLLKAISARLVPDPPQPSAAVPFLPEHEEKVKEFIKAIAEH